MRARWLLLPLLLVGVSLRADERKETPKETSSPDQTEPSDTTSATEAPTFELSEDVREALTPLFATIAKADVSRATVEMLADSLMGGTVVDSQKSTFQVASSRPDQFTIYLKEPEQRTRIYNDGETMAVALAPDAYLLMPEAMAMQQAVTSLPVPMGPYPEPLLALSLAGVDPAISLMGGMKSIQIVDRDDFRGRTPAIHLHGIQADEVTWDLWIARGEEPKPLRMLIDLTPMLLASEEIRVPENYSYQVRYDFLSWRVSGDVDESLFRYQPSKDAKQYTSMEDYFQIIAQSMTEHPLLGQMAPEFTAETLNGRKVSNKNLIGKVVVLDFWATWCEPCKAAIPILKEVTDQFGAKDVVLIALNVGEEKSVIEEYMGQQKLDLKVLLDPDSEIATAFAADAIPLTFVIGKSGHVESVHMGFLGEEALRERLTDELEVLSIGGRVATAGTETE